MRKLLKITLCAALALILTSSTPTVPDATCDASPRPTNEAVYRHNTDKKRVALTIDDGPHYKYTAEILDILDEYAPKPPSSSSANSPNATPNSSYANSRKVTKSATTPGPTPK